MGGGPSTQFANCCRASIIPIIQKDVPMRRRVACTGITARVDIPGHWGGAAHAPGSPGRHKPAPRRAKTHQCFCWWFPHEVSQHRAAYSANPRQLWKASVQRRRRSAQSSRPRGDRGIVAIEQRRQRAHRHRRNGAASASLTRFRRADAVNNWALQPNPSARFAYPIAGPSPVRS